MRRSGWVVFAVASVWVTGCTASGASGATSSTPGQVTTAGAGAQQSRHHRLTMPETLSHGLYRRDHDAAGPNPTLAEAMAGQVEGAKAAFGVYDPVPGHSVLTITGVYGTSVPSPVTARNALAKVLDRRDHEPRVVVGPRTITPPGTTEPLECRIAQKPQPVAPEVVSVEPSCVWGDSSTVVKVALGMSSRRVKPSDIDLDHFASEVAALRDEVRVVG